MTAKALFSGCLLSVVLFFVACAPTRSNSGSSGSSSETKEFIDVPHKIKYSKEGEPQLTLLQQRLLKVAEAEIATKPEDIRDQIRTKMKYRDPAKTKISDLELTLAGGVTSNTREMKYAHEFYRYYGQSLKTKSTENIRIKVYIKESGDMVVSGNSMTIRELEDHIPKFASLNRDRGHEIVIITHINQMKFSDQLRLHLARVFKKYPVLLEVE